MQGQCYPMVYCIGFRVSKFGYQAIGRTGIQIPMAQGRSTKIISMIQWIRTSRLSIKNSLSLSRDAGTIMESSLTVVPAAIAFEHS